jgi:hypothetical protein
MLPGSMRGTQHNIVRQFLWPTGRPLHKSLHKVIAQGDVLCRTAVWQSLRDEVYRGVAAVAASAGVAAQVDQQ